MTLLTRTATTVNLAVKKKESANLLSLVRMRLKLSSPTQSTAELTPFQEVKE